MNTIILFGEVILIFSALMLCYKLFGKTGAMAWVGMATILANVITATNMRLPDVSDGI